VAVVHESAGYCYALLLAAGGLRGAMAHPLRPAQRGSPSLQANWFR
jgi:hypothetical protein